MSESEKLDTILEILKKLEGGLEFDKDISAQIIIRLVNLSREVRALSSRQDIIDYNTQWTHDELSR